MAPLAPRWLPFLLAFAFALSFAPSAHAEADHGAVVAQLMKLSGIDQQTKSYSRTQADQILAQARPSKPPGIEVALADLARTEFAEAHLLHDIRQDLLKSYDATQMAAALRWLTSPSARRITALEEQGSRLLDEKGLEAYTARMATEPPLPDRIALIQQLDRALNTSERTTSVVIRTSLATARAFNAASRSPKPESQIVALLEAQRPEIHQAVAETVFLVMLMTYEKASAEDLAAYIAFAQKPSGRWYTETTTHALHAALEKAADRTVRSASRLTTQSAALGAH